MNTLYKMPALRKNLSHAVYRPYLNVPECFDESQCVECVVRVTVEYQHKEDRDGGVVKIIEGGSTGHESFYAADLLAPRRLEHQGSGNELVRWDTLQV